MVMAIQIAVAKVHRHELTLCMWGAWTVVKMVAILVMVMVVAC